MTTPAVDTDCRLEVVAFAMKRHCSQLIKDRPGLGQEPNTLGSETVALSPPSKPLVQLSFASDLYHQTMEGEFAVLITGLGRFQPRHSSLRDVVLPSGSKRANRTRSWHSVLRKNRQGNQRMVKAEPTILLPNANVWWLDSAASGGAGSHPQTGYGLPIDAFYVPGIWTRHLPSVSRAKCLTE